MQVLDAATLHQDVQAASSNDDSNPPRHILIASNNSVEALWTEAVDQLSEEDKQQIDVLNSDRRGLIQDVIKVVEGKHQLCVEKQWKFRTGSETVSMRDPLGRIVAWINKFRDVGTIMMQYDPTHAAIPWAAIRFVLEGVTNDFETFEAMAGGLEYVSSLIVRYAILETLYLRDASEARRYLRDAIMGLYAAVLTYLCKARRYYAQNTTDRCILGLFQPSENGVNAYLSKITTEERKVENLTRLIDAECLRSTAALIGDGLTGLNEKMEDLSERFGTIEMDLSAHTTYLAVTQDQILDWLDARFTIEEYNRALSTRL